MLPRDRVSGLLLYHDLPQLCSLKPHIYGLTMSVGQGFQHALAGASTSWSLKRLHCCHDWSLTWKPHCREQTPQRGRQDLLPDWAVGPELFTTVGLSLPSGCCPEAFSTRLVMMWHLALEVAVPLEFSALHKKSVLFYGMSSESGNPIAAADIVTYRNQIACPACNGGKRLLKGMNTRR